MTTFTTRITMSHSVTSFKAKQKPTKTFERMIKHIGCVKCDTTLNVRVHKGKGN